MLRRWLRCFGGHIEQRKIFQMKHLKIALSFLLLTRCAGQQRSCQARYAENYGADWIITQDRFDGSVARCWIVRGQSVANEDKTDGIHWIDPVTGHLIHISGWYNRVMVTNGNWSEAGRLVGVDDPSKCL